MNDNIKQLEITSRKVRLFLEIDNAYKKFYWFQMQNRDLYWGPSGKTPKNFVSQQFKDSDSVTLTIPQSFSFDEKVNMSFSYHESGTIHMKQEQEDENKKYFELPTKWTIFEEIKEPKRFFTLISKTINHYETYKQNLTKKNSNAIVFKLNSEELENRHYFEFFISPPGNYKPPEILIKTKNDFKELQPITVSLNEYFILVIRHFTFKGLDNWHPDKEIFFICT